MTKALENLIKYCYKCKKEKSILDFNKNKSTKDGFGNPCRLCAKECRELNKEEIKIKRKKYKLENKEKLKERNKIYYLLNKD